jgi:sulfur carrier protein
MNLSLNGKPMDMRDGITVAQLLMEQKIESPEMVAVELNNRVLAREIYAETVLRENDNLEFLYFMGGGSRDHDRFKYRL